MPKLDKRGKITIPSHLRKTLGIFPGMKFNVTYINGKIICIPYNYRCKDCGAEISEGTQSLWCNKCEKKYIKRVY